jgi:hypothetical protein
MTDHDPAVVSIIIVAIVMMVITRPDIDPAGAHIEFDGIGGGKGSAGQR